nr:M1 family aminopeptidase [Pseudoflavitalea sp. G-6-1-2]
MEYPTITSIASVNGARELNHLIGHEAGHNWFYGVVASNERDHPWMDEGLNTYYDRRTAPKAHDESSFIHNRIPEDQGKIIMTILAKQRSDQPIETHAADFTWVNNAVIPYMKTALWLEKLEKQLGTPLFDSCMRTYFREWQFRHPSPDDFRREMEQTSGQDLGNIFSELNNKGEIDPYTGPKKLKPAFLFNLKDADKVNYINFFPAVGYNTYDKLMAGVIVHNYMPPFQKFRYVLAPLYAFGSKQVNGVGRIGYTFFPQGLNRVEIGVGGARFSTLEGIDSNNNKIFGGYYRFTPQVRVTFRNKTARNSIEHWLEWKTFIIGEQGFRYANSTKDDQFHPYKGKMEQSYINQLTYNITNYRVLYPYDVQLQVQQGNGFYRASATGNYFLNYADGGGLNVRAFAAKFGYLGARTTEKEFRTMRYQPKLTAVRGNEDYTYSNYFIGRNDFDGLGSQQIMMRDGGLKLRTDLFQDLQGRSDNWIASMNFSTSLPLQLFPVPLPIKFFLDLGTYSDAWKKNAATSRFLYVGGIQFSLFKDLLNIYAPLVYSSEFRDNLKTVPEENKFLKKISFSIDIQRLDLRKLTKMPFSL